MKIVFLDVKTIGEDIDLSGFDALGEVVKYPFSTPEEAYERTADADVIVLNKVEINERSIGNASHLKLVCVTATGTNNLDKEYLEKRGIAWRNVAGYSTESVAQHTFALLFFLLEKLSYYDEYVKSEKYIGDVTFTHFANRFHEISGKTWGIVGLGNIGRRVAELAKLFGCKVIYYSTSGKNNNSDYERVDFDTLLRESDVVSVHAPLDENTRNLFDKNAFEKMKPTSIFINVGRGPIVVEQDLVEALNNKRIAAAGLDVLAVEPMTAENPLRTIKDSDRLIITPHIAWASVEARTRLMQIIQGQIKEFFERREEVKAIVFDLDGTLLDTLEDLTDAVNHALEKYQYPTCTLEQVRQRVGNGLRNLMSRCVEGGESAHDFEEMFDYFRTFYKANCNIKTKPYEGVLELLKELQQRNIKMAIVSNKVDASVEELNEKFFFEHIKTAIGEREGIGRKPAPDSTLEAIAEMGVEREHVLYVGDSDIDILTAKNAQIRCVSVTWGFRDKEFLEESGAGVIINRPLELLEYL